jgi:hypothetical protein
LTIDPVLWILLTLLTSCLLFLLMLLFFGTKITQQGREPCRCSEPHEQSKPQFSRMVQCMSQKVAWLQLRRCYAAMRDSNQRSYRLRKLCSDMTKTMQTRRVKKALRKLYQNVEYTEKRYFKIQSMCNKYLRDPWNYWRFITAKIHSDRQGGDDDPSTEPDQKLIHVLELLGDRLEAHTGICFK